MSEQPNNPLNDDINADNTPNNNTTTTPVTSTTTTTTTTLPERTTPTKKSTSNSNRQRSSTTKSNSGGNVKQQTYTVANPQKPLSREPSFKILVVGDSGCGKTCIIKRYVHNHYAPVYKATIGVDFAVKVIHWNPKTVVKLLLWDIAGQERYNALSNIYYRDAVAAVILYDVTRKGTFESCQFWKQALRERQVYVPGTQIPIPCLLVGNKCDLPNQVELFPNDKYESMEDYCKQNDFIAAFETSAKTNQGIDEAFRLVTKRCLEDHINHVLPSLPVTSGDEESETILLTEESVRADHNESNGSGQSSRICCI